MKGQIGLAACVIALGLVPAQALAQAPPVIPVQGYVTDFEGTPLDGEVEMSFRLYADEVGGAALFTEDQLVTVDRGHFTAYLGDFSELDLALFSIHSTLFLGIRVGEDDEMTPRLQMGTVPYAGFAQSCGDAQSLGGQTAEDFAASAHAHHWSEVTGLPETFPPSEHDHDVYWEDLIGVPDTFPPDPHIHAVSWDDLAGVPETFPPADHEHEWGDLAGVPETFPPADHEHEWGDLGGVPETFTPEDHEHEWGDITGDAETITVTGQLRVGNTIFNLYQTGLPHGAGGYSTLPLHLKTGWVCGDPEVNLMYNLQFQGHHFRGDSEINIVAVGYLYGAHGHTRNHTRTISGTVTATTYCSPEDGHLVFQLNAPSDWHASGLVVHFMGGGSGYLRRGADSIEFVEVRHSDGRI